MLLFVVERGNIRQRARIQEWFTGGIEIPRDHTINCE